MRTLLLLVAGCAYSQTCQYQMVSAPSGAVQVYQNGLLLRQVADYSYVRATGLLPRINPVKWAAGDKFTVVYPHRLSLSTTVGAVTFPYFAYQTWQEIWDCPGTAIAVAKLQVVESCSGSGDTPIGGIPVWDGSIVYSLGAISTFGGVAYTSLQCSNVGHQPDISAAFWARQKWDCADVLRAKITKSDGTNLTITGTASSVSGLGTWTPIQ